MCRIRGFSSWTPSLNVSILSASLPLYLLLGQSHPVCTFSLHLSWKWGSWSKMQSVIWDRSYVRGEQPWERTGQGLGKQDAGAAPTDTGREKHPLSPSEI